jgi:hypothetical protein
VSVIGGGFVARGDTDPRRGRIRTFMRARETARAALAGRPVPISRDRRLRAPPAGRFLSSCA